MSAAKGIDVLGLGAVAVDDFLYVASYPPPDSKARVIRRERQCGGLTATALVTAARLGARCAYAGVLGHDELSNFAFERLEKEGIDTSWAQRNRSARPIHSTIVVDRHRGTRNIFFNVEQVVGASPRTPAELVSRCRVLFVDNIGVSGMIRAARLGRRAGIPVVADFESDNDPRFRELLALADHLILSLDFASKITGASSPQKVLAKLTHPEYQVLVVTDGDKGCWFLERGWPAPIHQRAFKVKAVDTTGCGDVFHGAYAFALAHGLPLQERIRLASATAALKATRRGGQAGIPSLSAVQKLLKQ